MPSELPTPCPALTTPPPGQCSDSTDDCSETMCCNELGAKCFTSKMSELATDGLTRFHTLCSQVFASHVDLVNPFESCLTCLDWVFSESI